MIKKINLVILVLLVQVATIAQTTRYVKEGGLGSGDSWVNASGNLQQIINSSSNGDKIWVAKGTYLGPFSLKDRVEIYGGFIGGETNINNRDGLTNKTILSGDTKGDDIVSGSGMELKFQNNSDNISPVVRSLNNTVATILDGFIITKGKSGGSSKSGPAGIHIYKSSTTFNNCIIENNYGSPNDQGGAICIDNNNNSDCKPVFTNCTIRNNIGYEGAGVYSRLSSPTFLNCIFSGNLTMDLTFRGKGGAIYAYQKGELNIVNCLFTRNIAGIGGAIYSYDTSVAIYNSIFLENKKIDFQSILETTTAGNDIEKEECSLSGIKIENSVLQNPKNDYKHYKGGCFDYGGSSYCVDNINAEIITGTTDNNLYQVDPDFVSGSYILKDCSPLVNSGMNVTGITMPTKDIAGNDRSIGSNIDIGPYENNLSLLITNLLPVNNATDVEIDSDLKFTFDKEVIKNIGNIIIYDNTDNLIEEIAVDDVSISGQVVTINPTKNLLKNKKYYVKIDKKAFKNGNCNYFGGIVDKTTWTFRTKAEKKEPTIKFENITKFYGDEEFDLTASANSTGNISYEIVSGGTGTASLSSVNNKTITLGNVGTVKIKVIVSGTSKYKGKSNTITLSIKEKKITVKGLTVSDKVYDGTKTATISSMGSLVGVLNSESVTLKKVSANFDTENVGEDKTVNIILSLEGADKSNYTLIQPTEVTATIKQNSLAVKQVQTITWNQELVLGCDGGNTLVFNATSSSGLPVKYTSSEPAIGIISNGNELEILEKSKLTITAFVEGNEKYSPVNMTKEVYFKLSGLVSQYWDDTLFFDNSGTEYTKWEWYKNGQLVPNKTKQYYSEDTVLDGEYYVKAIDDKGNIYETCPIRLISSTPYTEKLKIYPNPVDRGANFYVETEYPVTELVNSKITVFDVLTNKYLEINTVDKKNMLKAPNASGVYIILLELQNGQKISENLLVK